MRNRTHEPDRRRFIAGPPTHTGLGTARVRSAVPEIAWPAVPGPADAEVLAMLYQLEHTQWWPRSRLLKHQLEQLEGLLAHAHAHSAFYRDRLPNPGGALTLKKLRSIPLLTRADLQERGAALESRRLPPGHGPTSITETSGSTGTPVRALATNVTRALVNAMHYRNLLWHRLDLSAKVAAIRPSRTVAPVPDAERHKAVSTGLFESGEALYLDVTTPVPDQIAWLQREQPAYVLTYPTMLDGIARHCAAHGIGLPFIDRLLSFAEVLDPTVRERCRSVLGKEIIDCYSTIECGMLALQCPGSEHYHVMSEGVLLEVLDERGRPCPPGAVGRVVITVLHNFATPLIRYDIGDYAEVGQPCACGRGLPVLKRIVGRIRNMMKLPDGERVWPFSSSMKFAGDEPIRQFQVAQKSYDTLEVRLALSRPFTADEQAAFERRLLKEVGRPFRIEFRFMEEIPRGAGGKFEDFVCEIPAGDEG